MRIKPGTVITKAEAPPFAPSPRPKRGCPSSYDPSFCEKIITAAFDGLSLHEMGYEIGVGAGCFKKYAEQHPEFKAALETAISISQGWWEKMGRENIHNAKFNSVLWLMNMCNRFGWRRNDDAIQKHIHEHKNSDKAEYDLTKLQSNELMVFQMLLAKMMAEGRA